MGNGCTERQCNFIHSVSWQSWVIRELKALLHFAFFRATCLAIALQDKLHETLPIVIYTEQMKMLRDKLQKPLRKVEIGSTSFSDFNRVSLDHARCEICCTKHSCSVTASLTIWQFFADTISSSQSRDTSAWLWWKQMYCEWMQFHSFSLVTELSYVMGTNGRSVNNRLPFRWSPSWTGGFSRLFFFFFFSVLLEKESALPVVSKEFKNDKNVNNLHI